MDYSCGHGYYYTNWTRWACCTNDYYDGEVDDHEAITYVGNAGRCVGCQDEDG